MTLFWIKNGCKENQCTKRACQTTWERAHAFSASKVKSQESKINKLVKTEEKKKHYGKPVPLFKKLSLRR